MAARIRRTIQLLLLIAVATTPAAAQLQLAAVRGVVTADDGVLPGATVQLADPLGGPIDSRIADATGRFVFPAVAPGRYILRVSLTGFQSIDHPITVERALPVEVTLRLTVHAVVEVLVDYAVTPDSPATRASIGGESIAQIPVRTMAKGVQDAVATLPGWATEDNGLLHVRGTDDGFLYVIDGVPVYERLDQLNGLGPELGTVESINVITGYIPAEFGHKAGGVIDVRSKSISERWLGTVQAERGTDRNTATSATAAGSMTSTLRLMLTGSAQQTDRFLDPVHPDGFHNHGASAGGAAQVMWVRPDSNLVAVSAGSGALSYDVPNTESQEAALQNQRQRLNRHYGTFNWQRVWSASTTSQLSAYARHSTSTLTGSDRDTPIFADASRSLSRAGVLGGVSRRIGAHSLKSGFDIQRLELDESFLFAVTDAAAAAAAGLSGAAIAFDREQPFAFEGQAAPTQWSAFVQDDWTPMDGLTLSGGVRFDSSEVSLTRTQLSPRVGAAYRIERTVLRGSVSRFFQPPQPEHVLLSTSAEARALSPFAGEGGEGGAPLEPERQWAFEAGVNHQFDWLRVDAAVWYRSIIQAADPNVFSGTTIIFPNAVAHGRARGVDLRVELPRRHAWSGYANAAAGRVRQNGPITGGLFLEDAVADLGSGEEFVPDHDQPIVAGGGVTWRHARSGAMISGVMRYESGTPIERSEEDEAELQQRPGAELVDFERGRVKPRTIVSLVADVPIWKRGRRSAGARASVINLFDQRYAYNFGNPFSGTHFGAPRTASISVRLEF